MKFTNMRRSGPLHVDLCGETPSSRAVNHVYRPSFSVTHFRSTAAGAAPTGDFGLSGSYWLPIAS
jgi:hypothetical protein